ncbi:ead/Ea22-like family protein [Atlantibacter subterranea]|uniref:Ead/Ea22-like family protein n=1 Tax=Atlantibacter subterraneus TaxID=255519 RepID=A0ABU4E5E2_9ENTR|nr:ead/Ea22-like family protein [Atlantibacter subterranea]MDV7023747.1 ead/Ea22-like family protein [Atlantibacter subterranea]MDZ5666842.1 ead/Ea22-like family protein [Atlantibacter hermannii]
MTAEQLAQLREVAERAAWGNWQAYKPHKGARGYEVKNGVEAVAQHCIKHDAGFIASANPKTVLALLDELERKDKRIAELEARTVALSKPQMVKHVSGEFIHCWPAYTVDSAIRAAGINLTVEG